MKYYYILFYIFTFTISSTFSQFTMVPDIKFEEKLINLGIDTVIDGKVLNNNIEDIAQLNINDSQISDLTGIEGFINLTSLDCHNNDLTKLDISNNTFLKQLLCNNNKITSLDTSNNGELQYLSIHYNELESLDISTNTFIKGLFCGYNKIKNLNISTNKSLQYLSVQYNKLINLDVSNNVFLKSLECNYNEIKTLNLKNSNNTILDVFNAKNNPDLNCIQVDNIEYSTTNSNWVKDEIASYSLNCNTASSNTEALLNNIEVLVFSNKEVEISSRLKASFKIYNIKAQELIKGNFMNNTTFLNLNSFADGLYILILKYQNIQRTKKFLLY